MAATHGSDALSKLYGAVRRQANAEVAQLSLLVKYRRGLGQARGRERVGQQLSGRAVLRAWNDVEYSGIVLGLVGSCTGIDSESTNNRDDDARR